MNDHNHTPFFVGITGASGSGKSTLMKLLKTKISRDSHITCISCDSFYSDLADGLNRLDVNFDHPSALDFDLMFVCLTKLKNNTHTHIPIYSFHDNKRTGEYVEVQPTQVIIVEGLLLLYDERIRNMIDLKVYLDTDVDICLLRRINRDQKERGRTLESILYIYENQVKPSLEQFVIPTKIYSDLIIPSWPRESALETIVKSLRDHTHFSHMQLIPHLSVLPHTFQIRQLLTNLRDKETSRSDFVFYTNRLTHLIVEYALGFLPFEKFSVYTPCNQPYIGVRNPTHIDMCCVSLMRGGECMENGFKCVLQKVPTGKILLKFSGTHQIEWNATCCQIPELIYCKLPKDLKSKYLFVLDPVIGRGYSCKYVIKELISRGAMESKICYLSLIAYSKGVELLCKTFPDIKVITAELDNDINDEGFVIPGIGDFSERYFGC